MWPPWWARTPAVPLLLGFVGPRGHPQAPVGPRRQLHVGHSGQPTVAAPRRVWYAWSAPASLDPAPCCLPRLPVGPCGHTWAHLGTFGCLWAHVGTCWCPCGCSGGTGGHMWLPGWVKTPTVRTRTPPWGPVGTHRYPWQPHMRHSGQPTATTPRRGGPGCSCLFEPGPLLPLRALCGRPWAHVGTHDHRQSPGGTCAANESAANCQCTRIFTPHRQVRVCSKQNVRNYPRSLPMTIHHGQFIARAHKNAASKGTRITRADADA
jgi:hypothetical protein